MEKYDMYKEEKTFLDGGQRVLTNELKNAL